MTASASLMALQILCGLLFLPHALAKGRNPETSVGMFDSVGLRPPILWIRVAVMVELVVAVCLIFSIATMYAALVGGIFLLLCAAVIIRVSRGKWRWNTGGAEFPVFWALCCFLVAFQGRI